MVLPFPYHAHQKELAKSLLNFLYLGSEEEEKEKRKNIDNFTGSQKPDFSTAEEKLKLSLVSFNFTGLGEGGLAFDMNLTLW